MVAHAERLKQFQEPSNLEATAADTKEKGRN
jgi:hypothetical protein